MDEMLQLHGSEEPNFVLSFAFKHLLPAPVRYSLAAFPNIDLHQWAKEANHLMADHDDQRFSSVAAVCTLSLACPLPPLLPDSPPIVTATSSASRFCHKLTPPINQPPRDDWNRVGDLRYFHHHFGAAVQN